MPSIINIAILAHVDAGKTTLTEHILYEAGLLSKMGDVNKGTATSDYLDVEKQRGISVIASQLSFGFENVQFNIIDTPGHADFISEVERSLLAVDVVILMISAADGVQAQTKVLWHLLQKLKIPTIIVINKIDRIGVLIDDVINDIKSELSESVICIQSIEGEGNTTKITSLRKYQPIEIIEAQDSILETLAELDDNLLEKYIQGDSIDNEFLLDVYKNAVIENKIYPIMYSIAKNGLGIRDILNELISIFSSKTDNIQEFSSIVYKVEYRKGLGKLCYLRIFSGELHKKQLVYNQSKNIEEKVNIIKKVFSDKLYDKELAEKGEIVAVTGLTETAIGDVLGKVELSRNFDFNNQAILTVQVKELDDSNYFKLSEALTILDIEDPNLQFKWYKDEHEYHININGWIQIQILEQILIDRFGIATKFETPEIIYKETPSKMGFGNGDYTMPKPCWAVIKLQIEPGERGTGISYSSDVSVNDALLKYQKEVERTISTALEQGIKGWEVTDIIIRLVEAQDHIMHSRAGDFAIVTPMAIMNGLQEIGTDLLEPIMSFEINAPDDLLGQISGDLHKMRAVFGQPVFKGTNVIISGKIPAATSLEYPVQLASRSGGKASIQMNFSGYKKIDDSYGKIRDYKGISPLDRAKYILKVRNAIR